MILLSKGDKSMEYQIGNDLISIVLKTEEELISIYKTVGFKYKHEDETYVYLQKNFINKSRK